MRNWMWVVLVVVLAIGGFLLFGNRQDTAPRPGIGGSPGVLPQRMEIQLNAVNKDQIDQSGKVILEEKDGKVTVMLAVNKVEGLNSQPAHIHTGSCPGIGGIIYPLNNVVDGSSITEINTSLDQLRDSQNPMAINVHKSAGEISVYTACGELPR